MSSMRTMRFQSYIAELAEKMETKFNELTEADITKLEKCLDFPLRDGEYIMDFDKGFSFKKNSLRKNPIITKMKKAKNGEVLGLDIATEFAVGKETTALLQVIEQQLIQKILMDTSAKYYKTPTYEIVKSAKTGKERKVVVKGTGSKNITPFGKAFVELAKVMGVEADLKPVIEEGGITWTPIRREMTEAQKASMEKGRKSGGKRGGKRGEGSKVKKLRTRITYLETKFKEFAESSKEIDVADALEIFVGTFTEADTGDITETETETEAESEVESEAEITEEPPKPTPKPRVRTPSPAPKNVMSDLMADSGEETQEITEPDAEEEQQLYYEANKCENDWFPNFERWAGVNGFKENKKNLLDWLYIINGFYGIEDMKESRIEAIEETAEKYVGEDYLSAKKWARAKANDWKFEFKTQRED